MRPSMGNEHDHVFASMWPGTAPVGLITFVDYDLNDGFELSPRSGPPPAPPTDIAIARPPEQGHESRSHDRQDKPDSFGYYLHDRPPCAA